MGAGRATIEPEHCRAICDEIGDRLLDIRQKSGPDSVYWLGSAKFTNEAA